MSKICVGTIYGVTNQVKELETNTIASEYLLKHYDELIASVKARGIDPSLSTDVIHDVYTSLIRGEKNGNGYDLNKGKQGIISVEQFVHGRVKKYCRNKKYRKTMNDIEVSASSVSSELEEMNAYQIAYEMAPSYDDIESIELDASIKEELEHCLSFQSSIKMNIKYFLQNLSTISSMNVDTTVFKSLREMAVNQEFVESLRSLVEYSKRFPEKYDQLVAAF